MISRRERLIGIEKETSHIEKTRKTQKREKTKEKRKRKNKGKNKVKRKKKKNSIQISSESSDFIQSP